MSAKNDGGPAFPVPVHTATDGRTHDGGMTLRDWFAAHASEDDIRLAKAFIPPLETWDEPTIRSAARYVHADAMLKAREA